MKKQGPIILAILDGWGIDEPSASNAIALAKTPNMDKFMKEFPHTTLKASGVSVGLPPGQDGNSEAGHMNIGAGRIVEQDAVTISRHIEDGTFEKNPGLITAINHAKKNKSKLHLMGLLTNGMSAHAFPDHLYALLKLLRKKKCCDIYLHLFTDGRDSSPHGAIRFLDKLTSSFQNGEKIATIQGRYYAMERNKRWHITEKAYNLLTLGECEHQSDNARDAILEAYNRGQTDEFIEPTLIDKKGIIENNDSVIYFNLRSDRARQLTKAFVQKDFNKKNRYAFKRKKVLKNVDFVAMTDFGPDLDSIVTAFPSANIEHTLPMELKNMRQLYIAESEKYAHVTYFFNGGYADPLNKEARVKLPSPDVNTYDKKPEMSAPQLTYFIETALKVDKFDFYCVNFANPDMVAHTGNLKATIRACECVDAQLGRLYKAVSKKDGILIITADHGNAEGLKNLKTEEMDTNHSNNFVPLIITKKGIKICKIGKLSDVAPTILELFNIQKPKAMKGRSLLC
ncbi:MAG: 2,3-bisphosphoglycerate-independent phosphoglycerate mutase [Patescibacteria group bacterium]